MSRGFSIRIVRCISDQQATVEDDSDSSCGPPREAVGEAKWPSYNGLPVHCGHWWHDSSMAAQAEVETVGAHS